MRSRSPFSLPLLLLHPVGGTAARNQVIWSEGEMVKVASPRTATR
jgi:hypothetical protein